jgi:hypothetical protein
MVVLRLACTFLIGILAASTSVGDPPPPNHPLIGTWKLPLNGGACIETSEWRADGTLHVASAESRDVTLFEIADDPAGEDHYIVTITLSSSNGVPDCLGMITPVVGAHTSVYILLLPRDRYIMCIDSMHSRCFGPYQKVPQSNS